jgi:sugar phosphate isomerase/epimerase
MAIDPMHAAPEVLISLSAFGADEVRRHGQLWFARLAAEAGADGVEIRSELLTRPDAELDALAQFGADASLGLVYSSAEGLWNAEGELDRAALARALEATARLRAARLKMSIGGFSPASAATLPALKQDLSGQGVELLIENDQTAQAGTLLALQRFFAAADGAGLALGMTFDMGNWHWTGECPLQAAQACAARVRYVHCKGVQRQPQRWVAVPLAESAAPWRSVLGALPAAVPWAIEYPLAGGDLLQVTRDQILQLREIAAINGALQ